MSPKMHPAPAQSVAHQPPPAPLAEPADLSSAPSRFTPMTMDEVLTTARLFYDGGLMPKHFYEDSRVAPNARRSAGVAGLATMIMYGAELGLSPAQSMRMMHVIEGRPVLSAAGKVALVKRSPKCVYFRVIESSDEHCTCETVRRGDDGKPLPPRRLTVKVWWGKLDEMPEPEKDVLFVLPSRTKQGEPTQPWLRTPGRMVKARCSDWLCGDEFEDVTAGLYSAEEVIDFRDNRAHERMVDNIFDMVAEQPAAVPAAGAPVSFEEAPAPPAREEQPEPAQPDPLAEAAALAETIKALEVRIANATPETLPAIRADIVKLPQNSAERRQLGRQWEAAKARLEAPVEPAQGGEGGGA